MKIHNAFAHKKNEPLQFSNSEVSMLHFLATGPSGNKVAKAIVSDFGTKFQLTKCCINLSFRTDQELVCYGDFGFNADVNHRQTCGFHSEWKPDNPLDVKFVSECFGWNSARTCFAAKMKIGTTVVGIIYMQAWKPLSPELVNEFERTMVQILKPLAIFFRGSGDPALFADDDFEATPTALAFTSKQQAIISRVESGRKPAKIALEIGYSAMTIKEETQDIFNSLSEDDRRDAAMRAIALGLISA